MKTLKIKTYGNGLLFNSKTIKVSSNFKIGGFIGPSLFEIVDILKEDNDKHRYFLATEEALALSKSDSAFPPIILIKYKEKLTYVSFLEAYELFLIDGEQKECNTDGTYSGTQVNAEFGIGSPWLRDKLRENIKLRNGISA